jgi:hypothetical protein
MKDLVRMCIVFIKYFQDFRLNFNASEIFFDFNLYIQIEVGIFVLS